MILHPIDHTKIFLTFKILTAFLPKQNTTPSWFNMMECSIPAAIFFILLLYSVETNTGAPRFVFVPSPNSPYF